MNKSVFLVFMITIFSYDPCVLKQYEFLKTPGDPPIQPMLSIAHESLYHAATHFYAIQPITQVLGCTMFQDGGNIHISFPLYATNTLMTLIGTFYHAWTPVAEHHEIHDKVVYSTIQWTTGACHSSS